MQRSNESGLENRPLQDLEPEKGSFADEAVAHFNSAPWWIVSGAFHGLLLLLVTLISMVVIREVKEDPLIHTIILTQEETPPPQPIRPPNFVEIPFVSDQEVPEVVTQVVNITEERTISDHIEDAENGDADSQRGETTGISDVDLGKAGFVTALGLGSGGSSRFGRGPGRQRLMIAKYHGHGTEDVLTRALAWLARVQNTDGHWDTQAFESNVKTDTACTGFALLAFLGSGHSEKVGKYRDNVRRAVAWLKSKQNAEGLVFDQTDAGAHRGIGYPHAIAGMALAEAAGMDGSADTRRAAQAALDYSVKVHQQGSGYDKLGFRYQAGQAGDLSVTGWFVMQLKAGKTAGLNVDSTSFEGALRFLDSVEHKGAGGDIGYGPASVYWYQPTNEHEHTAHRLTAMGTLCRQFLGYRKAELEPTVRWVVDKGGVPDGWGEGKTDLYYWYYGTFCTFQQGGEVWKRWNEAMKKSFIGSQRRGGPEDGSWDPVGDFSKEWGRVGQTALSALCLEVYYRYLRIYRD